MADDNSVPEMSSSSSSSGDEDAPMSVQTKIKREQCQPKARKFSVTFENFRDLPTGKNCEVQSSKFSCFGYEWRLQLLPGGYSDYPKPPKGTVGVCVELSNRGKWPNVKFSFEVKSTDGKTSLQTSAIPVTSKYYSNTSDTCALATRLDVKSRFLDDKGALTIFITMELNEFVPKNPLAKTMLKLFMDEESSDVIFEISNEVKNVKKRKRGKTSSVQFHAHRFILEHTSSELAALCESSPEGGLNAPILINDIKTEVFRGILYYIYGGDVMEQFFIANGKDLIDAADKYGVVNLKLEAEAWYCHTTKITTENVIDNLLYADSKNLALLKEAVMDYIVKNKKKVMKRVSFKDVPGDIYKDLLAAVSRVLDDSDEDDSDDEDNKEKDDYASMGIGALRQKLDQRGIDIDGSRDTLMAALKKHS
mmetsp:Transcript_27022/g.42407  ORF Transcript_27022/g.42407 Transcript_27022/m.42407 type:complete len:421 (+) Transcript_27022:83-1345(+)|eukprot:CAMPEP_0201736426 /NCGR_PEP_ID=MMETSP0593-20130828/39786_1 /ASSEMBLY_ACC=CAM_ASM_000672 /TAXON_ID=267983 /ORGANISM="Skeletonema japonicum, Strain CCMP2506" /LENGTH=420 /DNA_ID=CAMNT_0048230187 /DNA_START=82 /DNA_END=1344 /DNA_ORIENTATION=-